MLKQVMQFIAKVQEWEGQFHLPAGIPIEQAEQMALQFLQWLGKCREEVAKAQVAQDESAKQAQPDKSVEQPPEVNNV
jgi:hypothetical protein